MKYFYNSLTVLWTYILGFAGLTLDSLDILSQAVADPDFKQQVSDAIGGDPQWLGRILLAVSIVTFVARMRGIKKAQ